ncbi:hypothetical protein E8E01_01590 [Methylorubrum populi]|uniref:hypothetical protein n=1 Tax=Methylorubrum populi TaxID=223967 RepID=UPI00114E3F88|nr:hypothetical protein [Methylorubrum populi]QDI79210.1 hypothetical protein E8E01_01590 [Methylorubrum populi]
MQKPEKQEDFERLVAHDPVDAARKCRSAIKRDDESFQEQRRRRIAEGSLIAERLKSDHNSWRDFVAENFFDQYARIRKKDRKHYQYIVMRAVMLYIFDVSSTNMSKRNRVWRYARAMDAYLDQGVPNEALVERIKADGGIEKACRAACKEHSREQEEDDWAKQMNARPEPDGNPFEPEEGTDFEDEELEDSDYEELRRDVVGDDESVILRVEVTPEELETILESGTEQYRLLIRRSGPDTKLGGTRFIASVIDPL